MNETILVHGLAHDKQAIHDKYHHALSHLWLLPVSIMLVEIIIAWSQQLLQWNPLARSIILFDLNEDVLDPELLVSLNEVVFYYFVVFDLSLYVYLENMLDVLFVE